jgi:hypothetical protein
MIFEGCHISLHESDLAPNSIPHPPHRHRHEEMVLVVEGKLEFTINGKATTVTVSGLPADSNGYTVYVYADGGNGSATRTGAYQISGTGITRTSINLTDAANTNFSGSFTQANNSNGNYVMFTITANGFKLTATPGTASDGSKRAPCQRDSNRALIGLSTGFVSRKRGKSNVCSPLTVRSHFETIRYASVGC